MEENIEVKQVNEETPSIAEKEQQVLEKSGNKVEDGVYKVDLRQPPVQEEQPVEEKTEQPVENEVVNEEPKEQEQETLTLIKEEQDAVQVQEQREVQSEKQEVQPEKLQEEEVKLDVPENIQSLIDFMSETGGSMEDYVRLNADYSNLDESTLLREYYNQTKPHLNADEVGFLIEDSFSFDEEIDDVKEIKRKKLAYKEAVAQAKQHLNGLKDKYYKEITSSPKFDQKTKEAVDFFNNYNKEQNELSALQQKQAEHFSKQTENVFSDDFKGFDFKVGENKYRFNVKDVNNVKEAQSDILNSFKMFLSEDNMLKDAKGYHKALFAARNADTIANHFYEQGKADAIKQISAESKNVNMDPRSSSPEIQTGGMKVRALSGDSSSKLRVKISK